MIITPYSPDAVAHVIHNLRPEDEREVFAARWSDNKADLVREIWLSEKAREFVVSIVACADDMEPIALLSIARATPVFAMANMVATDRWREIAMRLTIHIRQDVTPLVEAIGIKRVECRPTVENAVARRWLQAIGFREIGAPHPLGRDGQQYLLCAWQSQWASEDSHVRA